MACIFTLFLACGIPPNVFVCFGSLLFCIKKDRTRRLMCFYDHRLGCSFMTRCSRVFMLYRRTCTNTEESSSSCKEWPHRKLARVTAWLPITITISISVSCLLYTDGLFVFWIRVTLSETRQPSGHASAGLDFHTLCIRGSGQAGGSKEQLPPREARSSPGLCNRVTSGETCMIDYSLVVQVPG